MHSGFIDLRQNNGQLVEESFWPSFTDVMTVIVMIFLIATTVLIIKNWELVNELQQRISNEKNISSALKQTIAEKNKTHNKLLESIKAKQAISQKLQASITALQRTNQIAEQNQAENLSLEERLEHVQATLANFKMQLSQSQQLLAENAQVMEQYEHKFHAEDKIKLQLRTQNLQLEKLLSQLKSQYSKAQQTLATTKKKYKTNRKILLQQTNILKLNQKELDLLSKKLLQQQMSARQSKKLLTKSLTEKQQTILSLQQDLLVSKNQISGYKIKVSTLDKELLLAQKALKKLNFSQQEKQSVLDNMLKEIALAQRKRAEQNKQLELLQEKYNKLLRPARSVVGKYVVEVRYEKVSNQSVYAFKSAADNHFTVMSQQAMQKKLSQLKKQYAQRLYVKIIIPDNSGLSYNDAWQFTRKVLNQYDYYYQGDEQL